MDFTTVVAVDSKTLPQLVVSAPTWRLNAPEIWERPLRVIYDETQLNLMTLKYVNATHWQHSQISFHAWPPAGVEYETQREKMLSAHFFFAPQLCQTEWLLKLDTDAICHTRRDWLNPDWFKPLDDGQEIVAACPGWGYSLIERGSPAIFNRWADKVLAGTAPIQFALSQDGRKALHRRWASWLGFYRTAWAKWCASVCEGFRMPIASEDGMRSMIAARMGSPWRGYGAKRLGWSNCSRFQQLKDMAKQICKECEGVVP